MNSPVSRQESGDICIRYCLKSGTKKTVKAIASLAASIGMAIFVTSTIFLLIPGKQIKHKYSPMQVPIDRVERPASTKSDSTKVSGPSLMI